ncbi:MAG: hypothetical protein IJC67_06940, partial [Clostridia bacterium]|nr:hypothetical protein [Clostridia bacterium]
LGLLILSFDGSKVTVFQVIVIVLLGCCAVYFGIECVKRLISAIVPQKCLMMHRLARFGSEDEIAALLGKPRKYIGSSRLCYTQELLLSANDPEFATPFEDIRNVSIIANQSLFALKGHSLAITDCYGKTRFLNYNGKNAPICKDDYAALQEYMEERHPDCTFGYYEENRKKIKANCKKLGS